MSNTEGTSPPRGAIPRDTIFVGIKPVMTYATAVMMSFAPGVNELIGWAVSSRVILARRAWNVYY